MLYYGSQLSFRECEMLRLQNVPPKVSKDEPALFETKWWDYRTLHPMKANYLFAECYRAAARLYLSRRIDFERAESMKLLGGKDFLAASKSVITGVVKARQTADKYGIPYDFWCNAAMRQAEINKWQRIPSPTQLYSDQVKEGNAEFQVSTVEFIRSRWAERCATRIVCATAPFYLATNYKRHPYQIQHLQFLKSALVHSSNKAMCIYDLIHERRVLTETLVRMMFPETADLLLWEASRYQ